MQFRGFSSDNQFHDFVDKPLDTERGFPQPFCDYNINRRNIILRPLSDTFVQAVKNKGISSVPLENTTEVQQGDLIADSYYVDALQFTDPEKYIANVSLPSSFSLAIIIRNNHYIGGESFAIDRYGFRFKNYGGGLDIIDTDGNSLSSKPGVELADISGKIWRAYIFHMNSSGIHFVQIGGGLTNLSSQPSTAPVAGFQLGSWSGSTSRGAFGRAMIFEGQLTKEQYANVYHEITNL